MTLANQITLFRLGLTILALFFFYLAIPNNYLWSLLFFLLIMFLDIVDGYLARRLKQATVWGAYLDPLVDKITIIAFLVCLTEKQIIPIWLTLLLIFREIAITSLRDWAMAKEISLPAKFSGKLKTFFQTLGITVGLLTLAVINEQITIFNQEVDLVLTYYLLLIAVIISYFSGLQLFLKNYKNIFSL